MPPLRTNFAIATLALAGFGPLRAAAQDPVTTHSPPPLVERCGSGTLTVSVGGESVGEEQYEVRCAQDGSLFAAAFERAGNEQVTLRIYPSLNHLFLPSETGAVSEYGSLPVVSLGDELLVEIGNWLVRELKVGGSRSTR